MTEERPPASNDAPAPGTLAGYSGPDTEEIAAVEALDAPTGARVPGRCGSGGREGRAQPGGAPQPCRGLAERCRDRGHPDPVLCHGRRPQPRRLPPSLVLPDDRRARGCGAPDRRIAGLWAFDVADSEWTEAEDTIEAAIHVRTGMLCLPVPEGFAAAHRLVLAVVSRSA